MTDRLVNTIAGRLSLREPQRKSLELLSRITELVKPSKETDTVAALKIIQSEFPQVTGFDRDFVSLCFALAPVSERLASWAPLSVTSTLRTM